MSVETSDKVRICSKCLMPESAPGSDFDDNGVCYWCRVKFPEFSIKGEEAFVKALGKPRDGVPDCLAAISGGKDGCYALYYVTKVLGLKAEAYTYVHDGSAPFSIENAKTVCKSLGVKHHIVSLDDHKHDKVFKSFLKQWTRDKDSLSAAMSCVACKHLFLLGGQLAQDLGIPNIITAAHPLEFPPFIVAQAKKKSNAKGRSSVSMAGTLLKTMIKSPGFACRFIKHAGVAVPGCLGYRTESNFLKKRYPDVKFIGLFDYIPYDKDEILRQLTTLGWTKPDEIKNAWHSDCLYHVFKEYMFMDMFGVGYMDAHLSNMIRHGLMTREEGLEKLNEARQEFARHLPKTIDTLGLQAMAGRFDAALFDDLEL